MDPQYIENYYELLFQVRYLQARGNSFQDLFSDIMERVHPGDFIRCRPWGNVGDRKNDGYLRSERTLFQCYAPNEMRQDETVKKIEEDYREAIPHWQQHFDTWIFVHNSVQGLGPDVLKRLLDLASAGSNVSVTHWGDAELLQRVRRLGQQDRIALFGAIPSRNAFMNLTIPELTTVIDRIQLQPIPSPTPVMNVPPGKMEFNAIPYGIRAMLQMGRTRVTSVKEYFDKAPDPQLGERVASAFRAEYLRSRNAGNGPEQIFQDLLIYCGGIPPMPEDRHAATYTVLVFLFDECEIFESPV